MSTYTSGAFIMENLVLIHLAMLDEANGQPSPVNSSKANPVSRSVVKKNNAPVLKMDWENDCPGIYPTLYL